MEITSALFDLVICDIDGCLAPESSTPMDVENLARIAEHNRLSDLKNDRPMLTVCSGRPLPFAEAMCRLLQNTEVSCIAENGVWLYHPGENRYVMDPAITDEHLDAVHEARRFLAAKYAARGVTQQPGKTASVSLYHRDPSVLREIALEIEAEFHERKWPLRVSMTWFYINCDLAHVSKATGIARLMDDCGAESGRVAGIGDTGSDRAIAEHVEFFACPQNASAEINRYAEYVSPYDEAAGVVDILQHLATL